MSTAVRIAAVLALAALLGGVPPVRAEPASIDCARARDQVDRWICQRPQLARLDSILGRYYPAVAADMAEPQHRCLAASQRQWREDMWRCKDPGCVEQAYLRRLAELEGLLPGALVDRHLETYPAQPWPRLLAVLPPQEPAAAPPGPPLRVEGVPQEDEGGYLLLDTGFDPAAWAEFANLLGDAAALRARFGPAGAPVAGVVASFSGLDLDDRARAMIEGVAAAGGRLRLSGHAAPAQEPDAIPQPDPGQCAFVHALP